MKIWITTDTHFGHQHLVEWETRPNGFEGLIFKHLNVVRDGDVIIHLGDFCIGEDEFWHREFMLTPGKKWLVRGNHDKKSNSWYLAHGWDWVGSKFQDRFYGKNILFSHGPVRYVELTSTLWATDSFDLNIHGHFHDNLHRLQEGKYVVEGEKERNAVDLSNVTERHKLLSIERTNYKPVLLETFIQGKV